MNGEVLAAAGGRVAHVFIGETRGFYSPDLSPEVVARNLTAILDAEGHRVPSRAGEGVHVLEELIAESNRSPR